MQRRVTAVILAGGASSRYGSDKAFALWEGRPFLARVGEAVRGVSDAVLILSPAGSKGLEYARLVPGSSVVPDHATAGPVEALRGAALLMRSETILVASCDAPGLPAGLARRLVAICEETRKPTVAMTPQGKLWSLFAIPRTLLLERLERAQRLEDLLTDAEAVPTDAEGLNVNEPVGR